MREKLKEIGADCPGINWCLNAYMHAQLLIHVQLWDPLDCSLPGSFHGIFQASILERVAISFFRGSSQPRAQTHVSWFSCIAGRFFLPLSYLGSWYLDNSILKMLLGDENLSKLNVAMVTPLCEYAITDPFQLVNYIPILLGRFAGEKNGYPLQYSGLENSMGCIVHKVTKSRTQLRDFHLKLFQQMLCCCSVNLVMSCQSPAPSARDST